MGSNDKYIEIARKLLDAIPELSSRPELAAIRTDFVESLLVELGLVLEINGINSDLKNNIVNQYRVVLTKRFNTGQD